MIHVADPVAFFDPIDETNERWEELGDHPDWAFTSPPFPPFMEILNGFQISCDAPPATLPSLARMWAAMRKISPGWGRCWMIARTIPLIFPRGWANWEGSRTRARKFLIQYQDRILFGSDMGPDLDAYRLNYRFLETDDEYFNYNTGEIPQQGRWYVHGVYLPDEVLKKIYSENAKRVLGME